jgi:hypothetical protein
VRIVAPYVSGITGGRELEGQGGFSRPSRGLDGELRCVRRLLMRRSCDGGLRLAGRAGGLRVSHCARLRLRHADGVS